MTHAAAPTLAHRPLIQIKDVTAWLQLSRDQFYRQRPKLEAAGFPRPLPHRRPMLWDESAILRWLDRQNGAPDAPANTASIDSDEVDETVRARIREMTARIGKPKGEAA